MRTTKTFAMAMTILSLAAGSAVAQDWHSGWGEGGSGWGRDEVRFDPPTLTLTPGQVAHFHLVLTRNGEPRPSQPQDFRVGAWPNVGVRLGISGDGFNFSADQPGTYRVTAERQSTRSWRVARGEMIVNVVAPAPPACGLDHIVLADPRTGRPLGGQVLTLTPGAQLELVAQGFDHHDQPVRFRAVWGLSSPNAGQIVEQGRNRIVLVAGAMT